MAKKSAKTEYDNSNSGALFANDKDGNDRRPDLTGKLSIKVSDFEPDDDGNVLIYLAAWNKSSDRVGDFLSIKASPPQEK